MSDPINPVEFTPPADEEAPETTEENLDAESEEEEVTAPRDASVAAVREEMGLQEPPENVEELQEEAQEALAEQLAAEEEATAASEEETPESD